jgi:serine/threonine protein kinase
MAKQIQLQGSVVNGCLFYIMKYFFADKFVKCLGGGSFAQVWLAESNNEKFGVKIMDYSTIRVQKTGDNEELIEQSIGIRSPYLIKYLQSFLVKGKKYIVMEFCEHKDLQNLFEVCKENDLPIIEDVYIFI